MSQLIGTGQNQVPVNGLLGTMAFQNKEAINVGTVIYSGLLTGGTGIINIGSGQIYKDASGNVGIGTASPTYKLDVSNTTSTLARFTNSSGVSSYIISGTATSVFAGDSAGNNALNIVPGSNYLQLSTNGIERMRIDSAGNLGLGVTPSAWATLKAIEMGTGVFFANNGGATLYTGANAYYNAGWLLKTTAAASLYTQSSGVHQWSTAPSGTAGTTAVFTQAMTLGATSNLTVAGTISPQQATTAAAPAYVKGAMYFDTTLNKLRIGGATAWETVTSV